MKLKAGFLAITIGMICSFQTIAQTNEFNSHKKATIEFVQQHQEMFYNSIISTFDQQFSNDPALKPYLPAINIFVNEHMVWEEIEPRLVKVYMEIFSESELMELNEFLKSPIGIKLTYNTPIIFRTFQNIGLHILMEKQEEFEKIINSFLVDS